MRLYENTDAKHRIETDARLQKRGTTQRDWRFMKRQI